MDIEKLIIAEAEKSPCKKRKVGAIITNKEGAIVGRGYNYNSKIDEPCEDSDGNTVESVIHAEIAAINDLEEGIRPHTIHVTYPPCENCQKTIDKLGMKVHIANKFMKFDRGKLRYSLIPPKVLKALAEVLTYGAKKYKPNNWKNVDDINRYVDATFRHLEAWRTGERLDSESGLSHLAHALTNISFLLYLDDISS